MQFRRDIKLMKYVARIEDKVTINKTNFKLFGPWNMGMVKEILREPVDDMKLALGRVMGKEVDKATIVRVFHKTAAYERIATRNYGK